jgi:hypothetical protein
MTELTDAAFDYLSAGLSVIALTGKMPNTTIHPNGLESAISGVPEGPNDDALIQRVFTHPDTTGIAIVIPWPYLVVDVDGEMGAMAFAGLMGTTDIDPHTPVARTPRGLHIWYADHGPEWRSWKVANGLDLKGVGGYVAAPPSLHPSGECYQWIRPLVDKESGQQFTPIEVPEPLAQWRRDRDQMTENVLRGTGDGGSIVKTFRGGVFVTELSAGLREKLLAEPIGNRNNLMFWAACVLCDDGVSFGVARRLLMAAAAEAHWTTSDKAGAIRSAYKRKPHG